MSSRRGLVRQVMRRLGNRGGRRDRLGERCGVLCRQSSASVAGNIHHDPGFRTPVYASFFDREASRALTWIKRSQGSHVNVAVPPAERLGAMADATEPTGSVERQSAWLSWLPPTRWLADYSAAWLPSDIIAGITLAAYAIPVSLAYAGLAALPPQVGIYGYLLGGIGYALFGSSRQLAIGCPCDTLLRRS
jgi:Sulfate permease family